MGKRGQGEGGDGGEAASTGGIRGVPHRLHHRSRSNTFRRSTRRPTPSAEDDWRRGSLQAIKAAQGEGGEGGAQGGGQEESAGDKRCVR